MEFTDYYKTLGIERTATADQIKKAYHKLALKYHPDKNQGNKEAEESFKKINEANEVLSDPTKRKKYDEVGANWKNYEQTGGRAEDFDWSKWQGQQNRGSQSYGGEGFGGGDFSDFFESIFGGGGNFGGRTRATTRKGSDYNAEAEISLEEAYHGTTRRLNVNGSVIQINIKPGTSEGQVLRLKDKGGAGVNGGPSGNIYITIHIQKHQRYTRKQDDLYCDAPVELYTALLGGKQLIHTLKGDIRIDIPAETSNDKVLRLKGMGMPVFGKAGSFGDLYATIKVELPQKLTAKEKELLAELSTLYKKRHD